MFSQQVALPAGTNAELSDALDAVPSRLDALAEENRLLRAVVAERTAELVAVIEELDRAVQARTDFLANVSHELRTPLTAILGFAEILAGGLDGPLNPRQHEDASTVLRNARRLLELVDDLIDLSRIEADRVALRPRSVDLVPVLAGAIERVRPRAGAKGIHLVLDPADGPVVAEADPDRVETILLHVLGNAIKFTRTDGTVRAAVWSDPGSPGDGEPAVARIDVVDTGVGIAAADQDRIFETFQRLGGPDQPGTGLGLAIARGLAELQDGSQTVDSTLGLGSRFSLRLPGAPAGTG